MKPFRTLTALAAPLPQPNIDTDVIIRVERCVRTPKAELGRYAFEALRFLPDGAENPEFALNGSAWRAAQILVCGENFGCGSSREMAVWAIAGMGIRCVIAPSFGEIFHGNCVQNGLLAIRLPQDVISDLMKRASDPATATFTVDLEQQTVNDEIAFEIDPLAKKMLLEGLDAIGLTLAREAEITAFQAADRKRRPWIYDLPT
ncbi:MAG: 3-isopropylmalate dehydratase small subunit [Betaproteobacteria bacterium]|nr:3-isopropylmalate dehydratase small subunit [Betaproteobacteria bacterium]